MQLTLFWEIPSCGIRTGFNDFLTSRCTYYFIPPLSNGYTRDAIYWFYTGKVKFSIKKYLKVKIILQSRHPREIFYRISSLICSWENELGREVMEENMENQILPKTYMEIHDILATCMHFLQKEIITWIVKCLLVMWELILSSRSGGLFTTQYYCKYSSYLV